MQECCHPVVRINEKSVGAQARFRPLLLSSMPTVKQRQADAPVASNCPYVDSGFAACSFSVAVCNDSI